jgi:hypothetical protein
MNDIKAASGVELVSLEVANMDARSMQGALIEIVTPLSLSDDDKDKRYI